MSAKWLTSLVRARQLQEDAAQAELADARRSGRRAVQHVQREGERLDTLCASEVPEAAAAFVAASVAMQAAAATHAAAVSSAAAAQRAVDERHAAFTAAAQARLAAEKVQEQHDVRARDAATRAEQRDADEVAGRRHRVAEDGP